MKRYLPLFFDNDWLRLGELLQEDVQNYGISGDSVRLTRALSQLGCCYLFQSKHPDAEIIFAFLIKELKCPRISYREKASITSFLALYEIFKGDVDQSISYFKQSQSYFTMIDEYEEETMMLVIALNWLYLLIDHKEGIYYVYERLKVLSESNSSIKKLTKALYKKENFSVHPINEWFWNRLFSNVSNSVSTSNHSEKNNELYFVKIAIQFLELYESYTQADHENLGRYAFTLKAQVDQFKHPWYRAFGYYFIGKILQQESYLSDADLWFESLNLKESIKSFDLAIDFSLPSEFKKIFLNNPPEQTSLTTPKLSFSLFHSFKIMYDGKEIKIEKWKRKKAEEILTYLLFQNNLRVEKEVLIETLFPNEPYNKASNRIYVNVHEINLVFKKIYNDDEPFVTLLNGKVIINYKLIEEIDVFVYLKLYSIGIKLWFEDRGAAIELFEKAVELFDKQLVPHLLYVSWLDTYRESISEKQISMLEKLLVFYKNSEKEEKYLLALYECDPFNEARIKRYLQFLTKQHRYDEANQLFLKADRLIKEEIGIQLSSDLKNLLPK
ncbi:bacterial transcriptional activator domain-containing protein [Bacillus sp. Marseille-P3661]|uniref:bacterial transcriptional activator domain-containing protein n=1 Tax=Bacillus sp. Marseille-P3661 TaxID=1936234 RepID=UPI0015E15EB6|nr:BTAD domain-containing putative transcriptional regulator [Bacillus sp. Marseille-P3661]